MNKEQIESEAAENSPYFAESVSDKAYREGFGDAGTRNNLKISELELSLREVTEAWDAYQCDMGKEIEKLKSHNLKLAESLASIRERDRIRQMIIEQLSRQNGSYEGALERIAGMGMSMYACAGDMALEAKEIASKVLANDPLRLANLHMQLSTNHNKEAYGIKADEIAKEQTEEDSK